MSTNVKDHAARQAIEDVVRLMEAARPHPRQRIAVMFIFRELPEWLRHLPAPEDIVTPVGMAGGGIPVHVDPYLGPEWRIAFDNGSWLDMRGPTPTTESDTHTADGRESGE